MNNGSGAQPIQLRPLSATIALFQAQQIPIKGGQQMIVQENPGATFKDLEMKRRPVELEKMARGKIGMGGLYGWLQMLEDYPHLAVRYKTTLRKLVPGNPRVKVPHSSIKYQASNGTWVENQGLYSSDPWGSWGYNRHIGRSHVVSDCTIQTFDQMLDNWVKLVEPYNTLHIRSGQTVEQPAGIVYVSFTGRWWEYPEVARVCDNLTLMAKHHRDFRQAARTIHMLPDNTYYPGLSYAMPQFNNSEETLAWLMDSIKNGGNDGD